MVTLAPVGVDAFPVLHFPGTAEAGKCGKRGASGGEPYTEGNGRIIQSHPRVASAMTGAEELYPENKRGCRSSPFGMTRTAYSQTMPLAFSQLANGTA